MDNGIVISIVSLSVSLTALAVSATLTAWQVRCARASGRDATLTPAIVKLNNEYRSTDYQRSEYYVLHQLAEEYSPEAGISDLPLEAQTHVLRVGHHYTDFAELAVFTTAREEHYLATVHHRVQRAWAALAPYIAVERERYGSEYYSFFEHLACTAAGVDKKQLLRTLELRRFDPRDPMAPVIRPQPVASEPG